MAEGGDAESDNLPAELAKTKSAPPAFARENDGGVKKKDEEVDGTSSEESEDLPLEEKRKLYLCKENYIVLDDIAVWPWLWNIRYAGSAMSSKGNRYPVNSKINTKISLIQNDITKLEIDAVVNAANKSLLGGGGVDGCIHRAAGKSQLRKACQQLGGCSVGSSKVTKGFRLPAKYIIHTVGPVGENAEKLRSCYESALALAVDYGCKTIAFCCISTGIYGYPNKAAAHVALKTVRQWLGVHADKVDRIIFCTFLNQDYEIYEQLLQTYFPCQGKEKTPAADEDEEDDD